MDKKKIFLLFFLLLLAVVILIYLLLKRRKLTVVSSIDTEEPLGDSIASQTSAKQPLKSDKTEPFAAENTVSTTSANKEPIPNENKLWIEHPVSNDFEKATLEVSAAMEEAADDSKINEQQTDLKKTLLNSEEVTSPSGLTSENSIFFWTPNGKSYHADQTCTYLKRSKIIISGTEQEAKEAGKVTLCSMCSPAK